MTRKFHLEEISCDEDLAAARELRHRVFVLEQGLPADLEQDGRDGEADHILARIGERPVGTGRIIMRSDGIGVIARIAIDEDARGTGLGAAVIESLERIAERRGAQAVELKAHIHLERFYEGMGYRVLPGTHDVAGYHLITMGKSLGPR